MDRLIFTDCSRWLPNFDGFVVDAGTILFCHLFPVTILFPSNEEDVDEETEFPASSQMSMFQELTGKHPGGVFPEDSETILSPFVQQEESNLSYQSRLDSDISPCYDLLHETSMAEFRQENKDNA